MLHASLYGRLGRDPKPATTQAGKPMCTAQVAVDAGKDPGTETLWVTVMAFGQNADALGHLQKGDMIGAMGRLQRGRYAGTDGQERETWSLIADALHSPRTVRPNAGTRPAAGHPRNETRGPNRGGHRPVTHHFGEEALFDDPLPF